MRKQILKTIRTIRYFPAPVLLLETIVGMVLSIGSFLIFMKLRGETLEKDMVTFDNTIWHFFYSLRSPFLTKSMLAFSYLGGEIVLGAAIIITILLLLKKHTREAFLLSFLFTVSVIIDNVLKMIIQRPRPHIAPLIAEHDYSFPSGHAMNSFVFYASLAYIFYQISRKKKASVTAIGALTLLILLIGVSRVYLGVHYATDVVAGYIVGFCWFVSVIVIEKTLIVLKLFRKNGKGI